MRIHYVLTAVAFAGFVIVQSLANSGAFGKSNAEVSALYSIAITPASWAFSIWPVIFLGQLLAIFYVFVPSRTETSTFWKGKAASACFSWWMLGWAFECLWQVFFARASNAAMIPAAACIIGALCAFQKALYNLHCLQSPALPPLPSAAYALFWIPTALNAAWLSVATALQLVITVTANTPLQDSPCSVFAAVVVLIVGAGVTSHYKDAPYGLTLIWSFVAIYGAHHRDRAEVRLLCIVALVLLLPVTLSTVLRKRGGSSYRSTPAGATPNVPSPHATAEEPRENAPLMS